MWMSIISSLVLAVLYLASWLDKTASLAEILLILPSS